MIKDAVLWNQLPDNKVECIACARRCKIPIGSHGFCFVRKNIGGSLKLVSYGVVAAMQIDPIEKKPFNHFMPGSSVLSIGTSSCNWGCLFCQNHNISKDREILGKYTAPDEIIEMALGYGTECIAFTFNEPTIFIEYVIDVAEAAHKKNIKTLFVTNGYMTRETVEKMRGLIDAVVVDFKGNGEQKFTNKFEAVVSNEPIKEALISLKESQIHTEITDLIIPVVGDSLGACNVLTSWLSDNISRDIPIHFTSFHPDYKMLDYNCTSFESLKAHYGVARRNGLRYVYIGNMPGNEYESTYCPSCGAVVISRYGFDVVGWYMDSHMRCSKCKEKIPVVGPACIKSKNNGIQVIY